MPLSISSDFKSMRCAAGEPIPFNFCDADPNGVRASLAGRSIVFAIYKPNRVEVGYHVGTLSQDQLSVQWILDGTISEAMYAEGPLNFEISDRSDNGRDKIANGTLTIEMSAPRIDDFDAAPVTRYITTVERRGTPANVLSSTFVVTMEKYSAVIITPAPTNTVAPTVSGTPAVGQTLTSNDGSWTGSPTLSRQWLRNGSNISGATATTYVVAAGDASSTISVRVTATNAGGSASATSATVAVPAAPVFTAAASITPTSGTVGQTFTGSGTATNTNSYTRSWRLNGAEIGTSNTVQPQATGSLTLTMTAVGPGGSTTSTSSAVTVSAAQTPAPVFSTSPSISPGSGTAGQTTFSASDGAASNTNSYARRWLLSGTAIGTGTTVTPASAGSLVLEVTATGNGGSTVANSSLVTVSAAQTPAPVFTTQPSMTPTSGNADETVFTASNGTASNTSTYSRRWLLDGQSIGTGSTVTPNIGGSLVLEVTAVGAGGSTVASSPASTVSAAVVLAAPTFRDTFAANPGAMSSRANWIGTYQPGQAAALANLTASNGGAGGNGSSGAAYAVHDAGTTDVWIDRARVNSIGGFQIDHLTAQPSTIYQIRATGTQSVVSGLHSGIYTIATRTNGGPPSTITAATANGFRLEVGDVIQHRYSTVDSTTSLSIFVNGRAINAPTVVSGLGVPFTNQHGFAGDYAASSLDEYQVGVPATQALISLFQPNRVVQQHSGGGATWRLSGEYTQTAPSSSKMTYTLFDASTGASTAVPVSGHENASMTDFTASGGKWSGSFTATATQLSSGGPFYVVVSRTGLANGGAAYARGPFQKVGDNISIYGQSLGVNASRESINSIITTPAPNDAYWFNGAYNASSPNFYQNRSKPMAVNTNPAIFANTLRAITSKGVSYLAGGFANTNSVERGPGSTYYETLADGFSHSGAGEGHMFIIDGQSNRAYPETGTSESSHATNASTYKTSTLAYVNALRVKNPNLRVIMCPVAGSLASGAEPSGINSFQNIRKAQWELVQENPSIFSWGPHMMDLQHLDTLHVKVVETTSTELASGEFNRRMAYSYAKSKGYIAQDRNGPTVATVTKVDAASIRITYNLNGFDNLAMLNASYNNEHHGGHRFSSTSDFSSVIFPTGATVDASPTGGQQGVTYTFAAGSFPSACYVRTMWGDQPTNPSGSATIAAAINVRGNMLVGVKAGEANVGVQPYFAKMGQTTVDYITAS